MATDAQSRVRDSREGRCRSYSSTFSRPRSGTAGGANGTQAASDYEREDGRCAICGRSYSDTERDSHPFLKSLSRRCDSLHCMLSIEPFHRRPACAGFVYLTSHVPDCGLVFRSLQDAGSILPRNETAGIIRAISVAEQCATSQMLSVGARSLKTSYPEA